MSVSTTAAPSRTNNSACAAPCPFAAPVISATLFASLGMIPPPSVFAFSIPQPAREGHAVFELRGTAAAGPRFGKNRTLRMEPAMGVDKRDIDTDELSK